MYFHPFQNKNISAPGIPLSHRLKTGSQNGASQFLEGAIESECAFKPTLRFPIFWPLINQFLVIVFSL